MQKEYEEMLLWQGRNVGFCRFFLHAVKAWRRSGYCVSFIDGLRAFNIRQRSFYPLPQAQKKIGCRVTRGDVPSDDCLEVRK
jgi:hypothetical protein